MGDKTKISWTDATWNPVTGCTPVSDGCKNCYAARYAKRGIGDFAPRPFSEVRTHPDRLEIPLRWRKPRRIFVCSMGDLFHESVPDEFIDNVFKTIAHSPWHFYQVLTKRAARMRQIVPIIRGHYPDRLDHVWIGVTAENQKTADERIPLLLQTPATVRFVSCEPMLGPVDLDSEKRDGLHALGCGDPDHTRNECRGLDWVICGGETGPGARPMHPDWARSLRDQCQAAGVPFHFKQWGEWAPYDRGCVDSKLLANRNALDEPFIKVGKKATGRLLDGREWLEFPQGKLL